MNERSQQARRRHPFLRLLSAIILSALTCLIIIEGQIYFTTRNAIYHDLNTVPARRVAIVFGAEVRPGGIPSVALENRLTAAVALYQAGKVSQLLLTGDNREDNYNEPEAMRNYAVAHGVPESALILDPSGLRTYDSCYRARHTYGIQPNEAIAVTQEYHLPRAIFTCSQLGLAVIGYVAAPFGGEPGRNAIIREFPARWLAWWQVTIDHPAPPES